MTDTAPAQVASPPRDHMSFCRTCGGDRYHVALYEKNIPWREDDPAIEGADTWAVLQCGGCHTITFVHSHWFSEDYKYIDGVETPIFHHNLFPPSPRRRTPEWFPELLLFLKADEFWIRKLLEEIYSAAGMQSRSLAAMGTRAIVDNLITSRAGENGTFLNKLERLECAGTITKTQKDIIFAAFDAGSAAAHRGYNPTEDDLNTLLNITESLLHQLCVAPGLAARQAREAEKLKAATPQRPRGRGKSLRSHPQVA